MSKTKYIGLPKSTEFSTKFKRKKGGKKGEKNGKKRGNKGKKVCRLFASPKKWGRCKKACF